MTGSLEGKCGFQQVIGHTYIFLHRHQFNPPVALPAMLKNMLGGGLRDLSWGHRHPDNRERTECCHHHCIGTRVFGGRKGCRSGDGFRGHCGGKLMQQLFGFVPSQTGIGNGDTMLKGDALLPGLFAWI